MNDENKGHGHVFPRPDGVRMRCGGPTLCKECAKDLSIKNKREKRGDRATEILRKIITGTDEETFQAMDDAVIFLQEIDNQTVARRVTE